VKVVFLRSAEADLKALRTYIVRNFGKDVWLATYGKIKESVAMIQDHPKAGRVPPELESLNISQYRQVLSGINRIVYEPRMTRRTFISSATRGETCRAFL